MESNPTPLRSLLFGLNSTFGNLAGIASPMITEFSNKYLLYFNLAVLSVANIFFTFFLKETVGKPILETIEELDVPEVAKDKLVQGRESDANNLNKGADDDKNEEEKNEYLLKPDEEKDKEETSKE